MIALLATLVAAFLLAGCAYVVAIAWADFMVWLADDEETADRESW